MVPLSAHAWQNCSTGLGCAIVQFYERAWLFRLNHPGPATELITCPTLPEFLPDMDEPNLNALSLEGLPFPSDATYFDWRVYYYQTCGLPGRVDRWLRSNLRCPTIAHLNDYLLLQSGRLSQHVTCNIEIEGIVRLPSLLFT